VPNFENNIEFPGTAERQWEANLFPVQTDGLTGSLEALGDFKDTIRTTSIPGCESFMFIRALVNNNIGY
jgi:hypothetical protein